MGQSQNPAKKAAAKKASGRRVAAAPKSPKEPFETPAPQAPLPSPSSVSAFKKRVQGVSLPLPSGLVVKAKRVELEAFIMEGNVPNPLMNVVAEALEKGNKADIASMVPENPEDVDMDMVRDMYTMVGAVVIASVVEPSVHPVPEDPEDRDDDLLYVDEIDAVDKMFIFQWASGGTSDLQQFREEARASMDALAEVQGRSRAAESAAGA